MAQKEIRIISTHVQTPKSPKVKFPDTEAQMTVTPVPYGKKRVMAVADGVTRHIDVEK